MGVVGRGWEVGGERAPPAHLQPPPRERRRERIVLWLQPHCSVPEVPEYYSAAGADRGGDLLGMPAQRAAEVHRITSLLVV